MSRADLSIARQVRDAWSDLAATTAIRHALDTDLVLAVIAQESAGDPWAVRVERGFWRRYASGALAVFGATASPYDDRWASYPDFVSASYGLMQIMYVVAVERGWRGRYPTELCDPAINLEYGCRHLRWCLSRSRNTVEPALLRWNGGGNAVYAAEVVAWRNLMGDGIVRPA